MSLRNKIGVVYRVLFGAAVVLSGIGLVVYTGESIETAGKAAAMCIEVILPSLFPFLVVSNLIIGLGLAEAAGRVIAPVMRRVFNLGGAAATPFIMGIIGGYPVGARAAITSYEKGLCTKTECERLLSFCNNSGPAFILGVVGASVFNDSRAGLLLYLAHIFASVTVGICFRFYKHREPPRRSRPVMRKQRGIAQVFVESVKGGLNGIAGISAFVICFAVSINLLFASGALGAAADFIARLLSPLGIDSGSVRRILTGAIEMTSGLTSLKDAAGSMDARLSMAAFMLGWAGVSVHCQVLSFIGDSGLSLAPYLGGKILHAVLSALYIWLLSRAFPIAVSTAFIEVKQVESLTQMNIAAYLVCALLNCAAVAVTLIIFWVWDKISRRV